MSPTRSNEHICVRPFRPTDVESFFSAVRSSIDSLSYWMPWCTPSYSRFDAEKWTSYCEKSWSDHTEFPLGIFDTETGDVVGGTGIDHINRPYRIGNLGYWVSTPFCGQGVARAAALMAAEIAFAELEFTRLEIVVLLHNKSSHRVATSIGATKECDARNRLYFNANPEAATVYSLVPQDIATNTPILATTSA